MDSHPICINILLIFFRRWLNLSNKKSLKLNTRRQFCFNMHTAVLSAWMRGFPAFALVQERGKAAWCRGASSILRFCVREADNVNSTLTHDPRGSDPHGNMAIKHATTGRQGRVPEIPAPGGNNSQGRAKYTPFVAISRNWWICLNNFLYTRCVNLQTGIT